jgi:hypothetical protein
MKKIQDKEIEKDRDRRQSKLFYSDELAIENLRLFEIHNE